jgi:hypothetical protein
VTQTIGGQRASVAAAGFASGGSAGDIMRDSASQGALAKGVLAQQGVISEAGYDEQAKSFQTMAAAGRTTAAGELDIAGKTDTIANQQDAIANQQDQLATDTQNAANQQATGDFITSAIKGAAAVASIALAPATGGLSLAGAAASAMGDAKGIGGLTDAGRAERPVRRCRDFRYSNQANGTVAPTGRRCSIPKLLHFLWGHGLGPRRRSCRTLPHKNC